MDDPNPSRILAGNAAGAVAMIIIPLVVGGPFVAGGFALIWSGIKRLRGR